MFSWSSNPFIRLVLSLLVGILLGIFVFPQIGFISLLFPLFFCIYTFLIFNRKINSTYAIASWLGVVITILFILLGLLITQFNNELNSSKHYLYKIHLNEPSTFVVKVVEAPVRKKSTIQVVGQIEEVFSEKGKSKTIGKALFYIENDSAPSSINYGDKLLIQAKLSLVNAPQNPDEFDYKQYLSYKNIFAQAYVKRDVVKLVSSNNGNTFITLSNKCRFYLLNEIQKNISSGDEFSVLSALLLGYENDLSPDLVKAYSSSGALHVLSVSGLHVAIIFIVFEFFLSLLPYFKRAVRFRTIVLLLLLWGYAFITGLSPSVLRSATMLSFVIIGKSLDRKISVYNSLAASAFLLLIINPFLIMDVGFQLSYLAVLGIVMLHKNIYAWWIPDNWLVDKIWSLSVVSISAQLATFPLGLLYFHQFPNYFLVSNLFVIPISTIILYCGMFYLAVSPINAIAKPLAYILEQLTFALNQSVLMIDKLPYSIFENIHISILQTCLLYLGVIIVTTAIVLRKRTYLNYTVLVVLSFLVTVVVTKIQSARQKQLIVYAIKKYTAIDFVSGNRLFSYMNEVEIGKSKMDFHINHHRNSLYVNAITPLVNDTIIQPVFKKHNFIQFYNKRICIIDSTFSIPVNDVKVHLDLLVVSDNAQIDLKTIKRYFIFDTLILDSSNSLYYTNKWETVCKESGVKFYSVLKSGAYIENL
ncbi:MAG: ComEC family competence protein [Bacteroidetes bacterium]|nr:ComEC family competence protein [Bacteroidota bacterium]